MPGSRTWYYPYGGIRDGGEGLPTDYTFTGQWSDGDVRLVHMGARWYDPQIGRWISPDTIVPNPANPQSLSRYSYVYNNPLRYVDPTGHYSEDEIMRFLGLDPEKDEWGNALAFFEAGGSLEGRWGWLAVLRRANDGSQVGSSENAIDGTFVAGAGGRLYVQTPAGEFLAHETVAMAHDTYFVRYARSPLVPRFPPGYRMSCMFTTSAYQREDRIRIRFDGSTEDWVGAGLDAG